MPSNSEGEGEEEEEEQQGGSGSGSGSDDEEGSGGRKGGFLEGSKAASFAKAFVKILDTSGKKAAEAAGPAPILAVSKSIAKRKAEVEAEAKADREAKKLRQEMKQRGHVVSACRLVQAAAARLGSCGCMSGRLRLQGWEALRHTRAQLL